MVFSIPDNQLLELANHCKINDFGVGECLLQKGILTENVYLILEGIAREHVENKNGLLLHDRRLKSGDIFGLTSLVRREPSIVTVCALSDIKVITIEIEAMRRLLQHNPDVAQSLENMANAHEEKISKSIFLHTKAEG